MLSGEAIPVTFRFEKHILNDVMDWFGSIRLFNEQGDTIDAQVTVNREAMICWAMQYGRYVEVLGPGDLWEEESTHCRLLYKLLNPEGSHGCGDAFLQKFLKMCWISLMRKRPESAEKKIPKTGVWVC